METFSCGTLVTSLGPSGVFMRPLPLALVLAPGCGAKNPVSAKNMAKRNPLERLEQFVNRKKTMVSTGTFLSKAKDFWDSDELRGKSKTFVANISHDITPLFSPSLFVSQDETKMHLQNTPFSYRTRSQTVRLGGRLHLAPWVSVRASFSYGDQRTTYKAPQAINPTARLRQKIYSPELTVDLNALMGPVLGLVSLGIDRDIARLGAYLSNSDTQQPSRRETVDTGSVSGMLTLVKSKRVMPYVSAGHFRLFKSGQPMRSKSSYFWGGGVVVGDGLVSLGYTNSKANKHYHSHNFTAQISIKF